MNDRDTIFTTVLDRIRTVSSELGEHINRYNKLMKPAQADQLSQLLYHLYQSVADLRRAISLDQPEQYETGDIVILEADDAVFGHVVVPAVVRYRHEGHSAYEVNAYLDTGQLPAKQENILWWTVSHGDILCKVGKTYIEKSA